MPSSAGYMGDSYRVHPDQDVLIHEHLVHGYQPQGRGTSRPSVEQWAEFWREIDRATVWDWEGRYVDDSVLDGTGWSIRLADGARRIESTGSNAAPPSFAALCAAISKLVDAPFQ